MFVTKYVWRFEGVDKVGGLCEKVRKKFRNWKVGRKNKGLEMGKIH